MFCCILTRTLIAGPSKLFTECPCSRPNYISHVYYKSGEIIVFQWLRCVYIHRLRARNTFTPHGGIFETMFFLKAQCLASILTGWLQLASGAFVCYLAIYVTLKIKISICFKLLSLGIKYMMFFGVQDID